MKLLIALTLLLVSSASAALKGYTLPSPSGTGLITSTTAGGIHISSVTQATTPGYSSGVESSTAHSTVLGQTIVSGGIALSTPGHSGGFESSTVSGIADGSGSKAETGLGFGAGGLINQVSSGSAFSSGTGVSSVSQVSSGTGLSFEQDDVNNPCPKGQIRHLDGSCLVPEITRKVFVVSVPKQTPRPSQSLTNIPPPKVDHNILFVRLPEGGTGPDPIVVPPPRQNNIVYVLSKKSEGTQRVIEVPAPPPSEPEIYFVNYDDGENPTLPGGLDLLTALGSAAETDGHILNSGFGDNFAVIQDTDGAGNVLGGQFEIGPGSIADGNPDGIGSLEGSQYGVSVEGNTFTNSPITFTTPSSVTLAGSKISISTPSTGFIGVNPVTGNVNQVSAGPAGLYQTP